MLTVSFRQCLRTCSIAAFSTISILAVMSFATEASARDRVRIVGSSTVYPFSVAVVDESSGRGVKSPIVESTGTGGGFKLFCAGIGPGYPDIVNASRAIKPSERKLCEENGVAEPIEVEFGTDGIVLAQSRAGKYLKDLTLRRLFLALAREIPEGGVFIPNPYQRWSDIDPSLPDDEILIYGPPPTSGTRDVLVEVGMEAGARRFPVLEDLARTDEKRFRAIARVMREDGRFVEAGENDNLIIRKIVANPGALGIFGLSFLEGNSNEIIGVPIDSASPDYDLITSGEYPLSRPLFFYVKRQHFGIVPGLRAFVEEFISDRAIGADGYLIDVGLAPLDDAKRRKMRADMEKWMHNY